MNTESTLKSLRPKIRSRRPGLGWMGIIALALMLVLGGKFVAAFRLDADGRALLTAWRENVAGPTDLKLQVTAGPGLTATARAVVDLIEKVPVEARLALQSLHHASVGVYQLSGDIEPGDRRAWMKAADIAMRDQGWTRVVAVNSAAEAVVIYVIDHGNADDDMRIAVGVSEGRNLVIVCGGMGVEPWLEMAGRHLRSERFFREA